MVQFTSPFFDIKHFDKGIKLIINKKADTAFTASKFHGFLWEFNKSNFANPINHDENTRLRRQDKKIEFSEDGAIKITKVKLFLKNKSLFNGKIKIVETPVENTLDINEKIDLLNITLRNVYPDNDSFLSYVKEEVFAFVMLFNQKISDEHELEMRKLTNKVKKELYDVNCPTLVIHSELDYLSLLSNASLVYNSISSTIKEKLIIKQASHNLFVSNPDQEIIFQKTTSFFNQFRNN